MFASYADLGLWFTIHLGIYIYVTRWVLPEERTKIDRKAVKEKKKETKEAAAKKKEREAARGG